jgi:hypothetical protein
LKPTWRWKEYLDKHFDYFPEVCCLLVLVVKVSPALLKADVIEIASIAMDDVEDDKWNYNQ